MGNPERQPHAMAWGQGFADRHSNLSAGPARSLTTGEPGSSTSPIISTTVNASYQFIGSVQHSSSAEISSSRLPVLLRLPSVGNCHQSAESGHPHAPQIYARGWFLCTVVPVTRRVKPKATHILFPIYIHCLLARHFSGLSSMLKSPVIIDRNLPIM